MKSNWIILSRGELAWLASKRKSRRRFLRNLVEFGNRNRSGENFITLADSKIFDEHTTPFASHASFEWELLNAIDEKLNVSAIPVEKRAALASTIFNNISEELLNLAHTQATYYIDEAATSQSQRTATISKA